MRFRFFALTFCLAACTPQRVDFSLLSARLPESAYTPSGDGWAEARRRRLVTRYLEQAGFAVRTVQRRFDDGRGETKYRKADLLATRRGEDAKGNAVKATLVLLLPENSGASDAFLRRQNQCDKHLLSLLKRHGEFRQIELVTAPVCFGLTAQGDAQ